MADLHKKIRGIIGSILQIGIDGPNIKNNSGVVEIKNADDSALARLKAATPTDDSDVVTKKYADSAERAMVVKRQADCSSALPANTGVRGFVVVTTAGTGAAIGDVLFDDGSGSGTMEILSAIEGRTIAVTDALSGGTISFDPDTIYIWDADGTAWVAIGDIGSVTGSSRIIRFPIDNSASQDSTFSIPANARVLRCDVEITTAYSGGASIQVGNTSTANLIQTTSDNKPQSSSGKIYSVDQDTAWGGSASVVRVAVGGTPAAGAGVVVVEFCSPLA